MIVSIISSLGAPLISTVAATYGVSLDAAQWSLTAALLSAAVAAPIMGRLGDGPYRREAIIGGLAITLAGSLIAGLAATLPMLVVGRAMQGVGLGLAPLAMAAARAHLPPARATEVIGILSVTAAAGVGAGYPISGLIADVLDIHAAFLFGALMSAVALVAAVRVIPSSRSSGHVDLDLRGAVGVAIILAALLLGIGQGHIWGWGSPPVVGLFAIAAVGLAFWAPSQVNRASPLVDLRLLRHREVLTANVIALALGIAMYVFLTVVAEFVQADPNGGYGFGASTVEAGLCLVPFAILSVVASRVLTQRAPPTAGRVLLTSGSLTITAGGLFFALVHEAFWEAFLAMAVIGIGFGCTFGALPSLIARTVPASETGSALGFYQVIRYIGFCVGSAVAASVIGDSIDSGAAHPSEGGYVMALWVGVFACSFAALAAASLPSATAETDVASIADPATSALRNANREQASTIA